MQRATAARHTDTKLGTLTVVRESKFDPTVGPDGVAHRIVTRNNAFLFTSKNRTPISGPLGPFLDFMTCPEVSRFLKWAEVHAGLRSTQLFDLLWVSDNLFNVHGGVCYPLLVEDGSYLPSAFQQILIHCLEQSLVHMGAISGVSGLGLSTWSQDPELMQQLDETYRKRLRPSVNTDGSLNSVTKVAWELYCLDLN